MKEVYRRSEQQEEEQDPGRTSEEEFRSHRRQRAGPDSLSDAALSEPAVMLCFECWEKLFVNGVPPETLCFEEIENWPWLRHTAEHCWKEAVHPQITRVRYWRGDQPE